MIWCNKNKKIRRTEWFTAPPPPRERMREAGDWCRKLNVGPGSKFYYHYTNTRWWFEKAEDATMFALKFSEQKEVGTNAAGNTPLRTKQQGSYVAKASQQRQAPDRVPRHNRMGCSIILLSVHANYARRFGWDYNGRHNSMTDEELVWDRLKNGVQREALWPRHIRWFEQLNQEEYVKLMLNSTMKPGDYRLDHLAKELGIEK